MSLADNILNIDDLPTTAVEVPEWKMTLHVRAMTGTERDQYESELIAAKDMPLKEKLHNMRAKLVVLCTVDENGKRVFTDDQVDVVGQKSAAALSRLSNRAQRMNKLTDGDIEQTAGN